MGVVGLLIAGIGAVLAVLVVIDVFLTVLHVDTDGPIATLVFGLVWRALMRSCRFVPSSRATLVGLAGPVMITAAVTVWFAVYVLGFALLYWPFMGEFRADAEHGLMGFFEALYFSGMTATVLGHGDITPTTTWLQVGSFLQAGIGFGLLTGIVAYVINVTSGVRDRNQLAFRLWIATDRTGEGARVVGRYLGQGGRESLDFPLQGLVPHTERVYQRIRRFPLLDLFYRSKEPIYAPELALHTVTEVAIASGLASTDPRYRTLRPVAMELVQVVAETMELIGQQHLDEKTRSRLARPVPGPEDEATLARLDGSLQDQIPGFERGSREDEPALLELAARGRILLDALDELTAWRMDVEHLPPDPDAGH